MLSFAANDVSLFQYLGWLPLYEEGGCSDLCVDQLCHSKSGHLAIREYICLICWCSLARENAKLREHACGKPVGAALDLYFNNAKSDTLISQQGASDTTLATSSAAQSSQKMDRAPKRVPTGIQAGTSGSFESVDDPDMPQRCWSSDQYLASTCVPARRVKGHERRPINLKHGFEAPDDLLDTAIMEWQNLCESVSADVLRSEQDR